MKHNILVTGYKSPDIDGAGGAYAYAELLRAQGVDAIPVVFGELRADAKFAFDVAGTTMQNGEKLLADEDEVIIVDASNTEGISGLIAPTKVKEVIDHRQVHRADEEFKNAKIQIELVGAAATLIVEKFQKAKIDPSRESAILLYLGVASNTINLRNKVTTDRDRNAIKYLEQLYQIDSKIVHRMFVAQSDIAGTVRQIFDRDKWTKKIEDKEFAIYQMEIVEVDRFVQDHLDEVKTTLRQIQVEGGLYFCMLTCVDLDEARNTFVVPDKQNEDLIGKILGVKFKDGIAHYPEIIMRKEIMPKIREYLIQNTTK